MTRRVRYVFGGYLRFWRCQECGHGGGFRVVLHGRELIGPRAQNTWRATGTQT